MSSDNDSYVKVRKGQCSFVASVVTDGLVRVIQCSKNEGHKGCCGAYITLTPPKEEDGA